MSPLEHSRLLEGPPVNRRTDQVDDNENGTGSGLTGSTEAEFVNDGEATPPNLDPSPSPSQLWRMAPVLSLGIISSTHEEASHHVVVEFASYFQIGTSFGQFKHVVWLTISYVITVTVMQPLVSSEVFCGKHASDGPYTVIGAKIDCRRSTLSFNFWILAVARGLVGSGSDGMGYMVTIILNEPYGKLASKRVFSLVKASEEFWEVLFLNT
ncbi:hypothetical protein BBP40_007618 [Aspergillus hancockii]|nr:hypothetical protein BBP40_007618 [Aspergillus hancockii]